MVLTRKHVEENVGDIKHMKALEKERGRKERWKGRRGCHGRVVVAQPRVGSVLAIREAEVGQL